MAALAGCSSRHKLNLKRCSLSNFSSTSCGLHVLYPKENDITKLGLCKRDISSHGKKFKLASVNSESQLILARVGIFSDSLNESWTVCPQHRYSLGILWKPDSNRCAYPYHIGKSKPTRSINLFMSQTLMKSTGHLVPIGSGICPQCVRLWSKLKDDGYVNTPNTVGNLQNQEEFSTGLPALSLPCLPEETDSVTPCCTFQQDSGSQESSIDEDPNQTNSQASNWSTEDHVSKDRLNQFITYMSNGNVSPLKTQLGKPFHQCTEKTKNYYRRKTEEILRTVTEGIAPGQGHELVKDILSKGETEQPSVDMEKSVIQLYEQASNSVIKTQLLSLIANKYSKSYLLQKHPELTKFAIDKARKYSSIGEIFEPESSQFRHKMSPKQIDHALDFFSDPTFNQVLAFGTKCLKLENGQKIEIPSVVRTSLHSNIIRMYEKYCEETEFHPLSKSTLYNILNACAASKQKSLKGLDNIAADGVAGFECIENIVENSDKTTEWKKQIKLSLAQGKTYLKSEYKMHVSSTSECADHCLAWALSEQKGNFKSECQHEHNMICNYCQLIKDTLKQVEVVVHQVTNRKEEIETDFYQAVNNINDWKAHIVRTIAQDQARQELLESMMPNQVLVIMDWAMKFLPMLFREKQKDWFGQKGRHCHVTVVIHKDEAGNFKHRTYTHLMDNVKQDYFAVASIVEHVLLTLTTQLPVVNEAFLRSDNAACYHSGFLWSVLPEISTRTGVHIRRYDFSEAQSGKSYCDAKIAHMRRKMRMYVAEKNNITTAEDMKEALDSGDGVTGCQVAVVEVNTESQNKFAHKFNKVTQMNNIEFHDNGDICYWKSYKIGPGEVIAKGAYKKNIKDLQGDTQMTIISDFCIPSKIEGTIKAEKADDHGHKTDEHVTADKDKYIFPCPEPNCSKIYVNSSQLENHIFIGKHDSFHKCTQSSYDVIKKKWAEKCHHLSDTLHLNLKENTEGNTETCIAPEKMGWAKKRDRKTTRYTPNVKAYLTELFKEGQKTGKKSNPNEISKSMRHTLKEDRTLRFSCDEWLQPTQISSFFSRLSILNKNGKPQSAKLTEAVLDDEEIQSILESIHYSEVRSNLYAMM